MKRISLVIIVAVLIVGGIVYGARRGNKTTPQAPASNSTNQSQSSSSQAIASNKVSIANMAFSPADITVKKGTKVTWTNNDSVNHTATENDGKNGPSAPPMAPGTSYSFTFNEVGTFHYHCAIHSEMTGTVTVTD